MTLLSVIVPAFNAARTIDACVAALCQQNGVDSSEILVIDDGSTDETAARAAAAGATVLRVPHAGAAAARNAGVRAARGSIVCCTDADCVPLADWLARISAPLLQDPTVTASKGAYVTRQRRLVARFVQLEYEDKYDHMRGRATIDFVDTYSAAYRRESLLAAGGFDERFTYLEDQELSFRLAEAGHRMVFAPDAVVAHHHAATLPAYMRKKWTIGYWKVQVVRRHPGRLIDDSHTPQVMKVQIGLSGLLLAVLVGGLAAGLAGWVAPGWPLALSLGLALAFLATTLPFVAKAWPKDRAVAVLSPLLLLTRALALGFGTAWGLLRPLRGLP